jgi:hypothetical protein
MGNASPYARRDACHGLPLASDGWLGVDRLVRANYLFCRAAAAAMMIAMGLPDPTDYAAEGRRVLFTLIGVAIGVVMFLAELLHTLGAGPAAPADRAAGQRGTMTITARTAGYGSTSV